ncbi:hypothetical protein GLAREA_09096 [Glarea lozoyensis ATCC 20868]|uniref:Uncharacterized protein n=1 Tax=Glarea lozoyensis (strain ATCC 20868 / MF5171) TaxID=1116229 RepID=S3EFH1_GLAL2|nr:uncharacterized protein GLAREA_09096 [Glarea lozoyensis ATCC 20868]EPE36933.1 hypothetical protein GLAREA_09096 [Glarea lozoyensis ATCC 20868]
MSHDLMRYDDKPQEHHKKDAQTKPTSQVSSQQPADQPPPPRQPNGTSSPDGRCNVEPWEVHKLVLRIHPKGWNNDGQFVCRRILGRLLKSESGGEPTARRVPWGYPAPAAEFFELVIDLRPRLRVRSQVHRSGQRWYSG